MLSMLCPWNIKNILSQIGNSVSSAQWSWGRKCSNKRGSDKNEPILNISENVSWGLPIWPKYLKEALVFLRYTEGAKAIKAENFELSFGFRENPANPIVAP